MRKSFPNGTDVYSNIHRKDKDYDSKNDLKTRQICNYLTYRIACFPQKIYVRLFFMYYACCLTQMCLEPLNEHILYSAERFLSVHLKAAGCIIRYAYHLHRPPGAGDISFI